ncbi:MAG TPA: lysophospholipid acyltransferase family protein [Bacillales bacterium]|nr:lysophospholipid acyltransferase family protein [Bacillales bacterium]
MGLYESAQGPILAYFKLIHRLKVIGAENVPKEGGVLLCGNHINNLDPPLVGAASPRPVHFMAKAELFEVPILKSLLPKIHAFPVKRGAGDRQALRAGLKVLDDGKIMGLFPEGTRSKDGKLGKAFSGAGFFALRSSAHIVPCAIMGSYRPPARVTVIFGEPIDFSELREQKTSATRATEIIMENVRLLMKRHGSKA